MKAWRVGLNITPGKDRLSFCHDNSAVALKHYTPFGFVYPNGSKNHSLFDQCLCRHMYKTSHTFLDLMNRLTNDPFLCAEDKQATFSEPSELGWVGSPGHRLSDLGKRLCV